MLGLEAMKRIECKDKKFCECGCGKSIFVKDNWGRPNRFHKGHNLSNSGRFKKGDKHSDEWKKQQSERLTGHTTNNETRRKIGEFFRGKRLSDTHKKKLSDAKSGKFGSISNNWKGDAVTNKPLHKWIRKHFPAPDRCGFCQEKKKLHLANMTGLYNREFKNWKYLCPKCHQHYDDMRKGGIRGLRS